MSNLRNIKPALTPAEKRLRKKLRKTLGYKVQLRGGTSPDA